MPELFLHPLFHSHHPNPILDKTQPHLKVSHLPLSSHVNVLCSMSFLIKSISGLGLFLEGESKQDQVTLFSWKQKEKGTRDEEIKRAGINT